MLTSCATDSCGPTKERFLEKYARFVDKVDSKNLPLDEETWKKMDQKFDKYISDCYTEFEDDLTHSEQVDFAANTVRYYYSKYGQGFAEQFGLDPNAFAHMVSENVEQFLHGHEDEIEALIEEFAHNIDRKELERLIEKGTEFIQSLTEDVEQ